MAAAGGRRLRPHGAHALAHVVHRARVGEEHVLDARADGAHREIGRGCCSIFIIAAMCGNTSTARARFSRMKRS
jgi:hypothetical protein